MFRQIINWRTGLALVAIGIVVGTIFYSQYVARKIEKEEREKVELWVAASHSLLDPLDTTNTTLAIKIILSNKDIPIIETNEKDSIINYINLDSTRIGDNEYLR